MGRVLHNTMEAMLLVPWVAARAYATHGICEQDAVSRWQVAASARLNACERPAPELRPGKN